jgi:hypothetical protein
MISWMNTNHARISPVVTCSGHWDNGLMGCV